MLKEPLLESMPVRGVLVLGPLTCVVYSNILCWPSCSLSYCADCVLCHAQQAIAAYQEPSQTVKFIAIAQSTCQFPHAVPFLCPTAQVAFYVMLSLLPYVLMSSCCVSLPLSCCTGCTLYDAQRAIVGLPVPVSAYPEPIHTDLLMLGVLAFALLYRLHSM